VFYSKPFKNNIFIIILIFHQINKIKLQLIVGKPPFENETNTMDSTRELILQAKINFPADFPPDAQEVVNALVQTDPEGRMDLERVLETNWLKTVV
jgi:serine/threonine protein kinase